MSAIDSDLESRILFEDNHLIVVNKKAGEIVQGDKTGDEPLSDRIKRFLVEKYNKPGNAYLGVVHRIDRPTSGVVVFAKTSKAASRLSKSFKEKEIDKCYWAVTADKPDQDQGELRHFLKKKSANNKSYRSGKADKEAKEAVLEYTVRLSSDRYHLWEVKPITGRHHQIRVQLAAIKCPIKGDLKYGAKRSNKDGSICLHARSIGFTHPVDKEPVLYTAPVPEDPLWKFFEQNIATTST